MSLACFPFKTGITQNGLPNDVCFVTLVGKASIFFFSELKLWTFVVLYGKVGVFRTKLCFREVES